MTFRRFFSRLVLRMNRRLYTSAAFSLGRAYAFCCSHWSGAAGYLHSDIWRRESL